MTLYLVGYMYSGKTTLGRELAKKLKYRFVDTDQLFEECYHTHITLFFQKYGEAAFRTLEQRVLHNTAEMDNTVVATGGGTACYGDNMRWINQHGCSIYLHMDADSIYERQAHSRKLRPIFAGMDANERYQYIVQHLQQRMPYYQQAHITVDGTNINIGLLIQAIQQQQSN